MILFDKLDVYVVVEDDSGGCAFRLLYFRHPAFYAAFIFILCDLLF